MNVDFYTEEDSSRLLSLVKGGAVIAFLYCPNVLVSGKLLRISEKCDLSPFAIGGVAYLPRTVFEEHLGKSLGAISEDLVKVKDGVEYFPAVKTCLSLGVPVKAFYDGRMIVMADADAISSLEGEPRLVYAASYEMFDKFDATRFTNEDYVRAKDSYRRRLVGDESLNDLSSDDFREKLAAIDRQCETLRATMHRGDSIPKLWGDEPPTESSELCYQYSRILSLARAFGTYGSEYYRNGELLEDILFALQWMYENMYGEAELEERSKWRSRKIFNWWDWYVGGPESLTDTLLIMENYLTREKISNYLKLFEYIVDNTNLGDTHAQGRSRVGAKAALLLEQPARLERAFRDYNIMLGIVTDGHGLHRDFTHFWHGFPYNLMYGLAGFTRILTVSSALKGTPLEFRSPREYNQFLSAKYMLEAAIHNGRGFSMFNGRGNGGSETDNGFSAIIGLLPLIGLFGEDEDLHLRKLVKRSCATEELRSRAVRACPFTELSKLKSIFEDDTIPYESDYELGYVWYTGDRAAQHRKKYSIALAVCSEREPSYESINSANKFGWYTGDGAVYLYTDHDREAFDGCNFYNNKNIGYRIPGTTVDSQKRIAKSISMSNAWRTSKSFAGGISVDDKYVFAGFDYESFHFEGPDSGLDDPAYGGGLNVHHNDLVAKKAWFMFDKECVCLGAGINSTMNSAVITVVEHRRLIKALDGVRGAEDVTVDGTLMPKSEYRKKYNSPTWINIEGTSGYVFPEGGEVSVSRYLNTDAPTEKDFISYVKCYDPEKPFIQITIEHGENPKDGTYAYVMLPTASDRETEEYANSPETNIISNTKALQAVRKSALGITAMVFHEACECEGVRVSAPCIATLKESDEYCELRLTDPTHKLDYIAVTLEKAITVTDCDTNVTVVDKRTLRICLEGMNGAPTTLRFVEC